VSKSLFQRREDLRLQIQRLGPILQGSVTTMAVRCGNPNCRCAKGQKHRSTCFSYTREGKTKMVYLGKDLAPQAQEWVDNFKALMEIVRQLTDVNVELLKKDRGKRRSPASKTPKKSK
jgi:hypothetical protein